MTTVGRIRLNYPRHQLSALGTEFQRAIERVLDSGVYVAGEENAALERDFSLWLGRANAVCTSSGSTALEAALHGLEVGEGDHVAVTSNLDISAVAPIVRVGARIGWVDLSPGTVNMSASDLEHRWRDEIRAILLVHAHGYPADAHAIAKVAARHRVPLIEDITHSPGVLLCRRKVGSFGDVTVMSCAPTKPLGAIGNHGLLACDDGAIANRVREYSSYGFELSSLNAFHAGEVGAQFAYASIGVNGLPEEMQAAVVRLKLAKVDGWAERRTQIARAYDAFFAELPDRAVTPAAAPVGARPAPRNYVIQAHERDRLALALASRGIQTSYNYVPSLHRQPVFARDAPMSLPVTETLDNTILGLPNSPALSDGQVEFVLAALRAELAA